MNIFTIQNLPTIMALAGWGIAGSFVLIGMFGISARSRRKESDELADGLIGRLQTTVNQNATDMKVMGERIDAQQKEIHQLQGKNDAYLQIITLRDPQTAKVFAEAPKIFAVAENTNTLTKANNVAIAELTNKISDFIEALRPVLIPLDPKAFLAAS